MGGGRKRAKTSAANASSQLQRQSNDDDDDDNDDDNDGDVRSLASTQNNSISIPRVETSSSAMSVTSSGTWKRLDIEKQNIVKVCQSQLVNLCIFLPQANKITETHAQTLHEKHYRLCVLQR